MEDLKELPLEKLKTRFKSSRFIQWLLVFTIMLNIFSAFISERYALIAIGGSLFIMLILIENNRKKMKQEIERRSNITPAEKINQ